MKTTFNKQLFKARMLSDAGLGERVGRNNHCKSPLAKKAEKAKKKDKHKLAFSAANVSHIPNDGGHKFPSNNFKKMLIVSSDQYW